MATAYGYPGRCRVLIYPLAPRMVEGLEKAPARVSNQPGCVRSEGERQPSGLPVSRGA